MKSATHETSTRKPLIEALRGERGAPPPVWLMRQAGRYLPEYRELRAKAGGFLRFCYTPELAVEATLQPIRRFAMDGAILFSDILVVADALGRKVGFVEGRGPVLEPLSGDDEIRELSLGRLDERLAPVWQAASETRARLPAHVALIGFVGAPWTLACYVIEGAASRDFARARAFAHGNPEAFGRLLGILGEAAARHAIAQIEAGADAIQIFDSWAGCLPEDGLRRWSLAPIAEIARRIKAAHPEVPVIAFPRGAGAMYEAYAAEAGLDALSIDTAVPLAWAADRLQARAVLQGNLDPALVTVGGEPMTRAARRILEVLGHGPLVFNLGHGVLPETPPGHVAALVETVRRWRA
ncbi:MAG TPA: uroporphyrinogen decarboxylase [Alphaproteobacteria bacterium]